MTPAPRGRHTLEFYEDEHGDQPVLRWLREELTPTQRRAIGVAMRELLEELGVGVCETEFGRQLGGGLFEFRLRQDAEEVLRRVGKEPRQAEPKGEESSSASSPRLRRARHPAARRLRQGSPPKPAAPGARD